MSQQFIDVDDDDWTSDLGSQDILDELKEGITKLPSDIDDNEYDSESESESQLVPMAKPEIKKEKTFLVMSMCHGNKIITRNINTLDPDFVNYLNELKTESWYEFVRKTYICGTAPFGNVCIISDNTEASGSRYNTSQNFKTFSSSVSVKNSDRKSLAASIKTTNQQLQVSPDFDLSSGNQKPKTSIYAENAKTFNAYNPGYFPIRGITNPTQLRIEIVPSKYTLSGRNTDNQDELVRDDPTHYSASRDFYSGIFVSILTDGTNTFIFDELFNIADGKHIMEIFKRVKESIPGIDTSVIDGKQLYDAIQKYIVYWNQQFRPRVDINNAFSDFIINYKSNGYMVPNKTNAGKTLQNYFIITQMNTVTVYVLVNLIFDFLDFKTRTPNEPYNPSFPQWIDDLKEQNSKVINISTACESVDTKLAPGIVQEVSNYVTNLSIKQTDTQQEVDFEEDKPIIDFDRVNKYVERITKRLFRKQMGLSIAQEPTSEDEADEERYAKFDADLKRGLIERGITTDSDTPLTIEELSSNTSKPKYSFRPDEINKTIKIGKSREQPDKNYSELPNTQNDGRQSIKRGPVGGTRRTNNKRKTYRRITKNKRRKTYKRKTYRRRTNNRRTYKK
jgi:hypothetical protein